MILLNSKCEITISHILNCIKPLSKLNSTCINFILTKTHFWNAVINEVFKSLNLDIKLAFFDIIFNFLENENIKKNTTEHNLILDKLILNYITIFKEAILLLTKEYHLMSPFGIKVFVSLINTGKESLNYLDISLAEIMNFKETLENLYYDNDLDQETINIMDYIKELLSQIIQRQIPNK